MIVKTQCLAIRIGTHTHIQYANHLQYTSACLRSCRLCSAVCAAAADDSQGGTDNAVAAAAADDDYDDDDDAAAPPAAAAVFLRSAAPLREIQQFYVAFPTYFQALKDPFADALGGVPPGIFGVVDKDVQKNTSNKITFFALHSGHVHH